MNKPDLNCKSILLIEDDNDLLDNIADLFEIEGYSVIKTLNGQEALHALARLSPAHLPGCIIMDLMMPVMNGKEFMQVLRRDHQDDWAKIPVFVITALGPTAPEIKDLPLAVDILLKPFGFDELLAIARKHCGVPQ